MIEINFSDALKIIETLRIKHNVLVINFRVFRTAATLIFKHGRVRWNKEERKMELLTDEYQKIFEYLQSINLLDHVKIEEDSIQIEFYIKDE